MTKRRPISFPREGNRQNALQGKKLDYVENVEYLGIILHERYNSKTPTEAVRTYMYSRFKREQSSVNTKVSFYMYNKVRIDKHLSDNFLIQNGIKQGDALSPLLFNFALEYAIRKMLGSS
jgi:hypothetical protein